MEQKKSKKNLLESFLPVPLHPLFKKGIHLLTNSDSSNTKDKKE